MSLGTIHLVVPGRLDQRTGGYLYDARMAEGLRARGRSVHVHELEGAFPTGDAVAASSLASALASIPDGGVVIVDGLAGGGLPQVLEGESGRLGLIALVHHPLADETGITFEDARRFERSERAALAACRGVVVTSGFTARRLAAFGVSPERIRVVPPGTAAAPPARGPEPTEPPRLICVGSLTPRKGHDVLIRALHSIADLEWTCVFAGSGTLDPPHAESLRTMLRELDLDERVILLGELDGPSLERWYDRSSLFVLASHYEGYGMALTEAIARGLPVVSTTGGAIPFTVPREAGILVPPGDADALSGVLRSLLADGGSSLDLLRGGALRAAAALPSWEDSVSAFETALAELAAGPPAAGGGVFSADWLALREPVDHRTRAEELMEPLVREWRARGWTRVLDLGSGTGSNVRYLSPRLPRPQAWTLVDHDPSLLARAALPASADRVERVVLDLAEGDLGRIGDADLVAGAALLDLVSEEWLAQVVAWCTSASRGALFSTVYDGTVAWYFPGLGEASQGAVSVRSRPGDPADDARVLALVNAHQTRDKGLGAALGPAAASVARVRFERAGYRTWLVPSPWVLGPGEAALALQLVDGWEEAAAEECPSEAGRIGRWAAARRDWIEEGRFVLTVGHLDLLALPRREG